MGDPYVSVLTPVRDGASYIGHTIASIRAQTFTDWEHIVVDDGSTDETPSILEAAGREDPRLRYLRRDESGGPYVAANQALTQARGRYIVGIDADDVAPPHRVDTQVRFLDSTPFRACTGAWRTIDEDGTLTGSTRHPVAGTSRALAWALPMTSHLIHSTLAVERDALLELGGYREMRISADFGLWLDLCRRGWLGVLPDVLVDYRQHAQGISNRTQAMRGECLVLFAEHIRELTGEQWTDDDVAVLWGAGRWEPTPLRTGSAVLGRWERLWRADASLGRRERAQLARLTRRVRLRHMKWNHGRDIAGVVAGLLGRTPIGSR